jgi:hypothetical protein
VYADFALFHIDYLVVEMQLESVQQRIKDTRLNLSLVADDSVNRVGIRELPEVRFRLRS